MGKKILSSQVEVKISKSASEKKQLNSLLKVVRPKVYITDSSSFKSLVQQLTGNGTSSSSSSVFSPPSSSNRLPQIVEKVVPAVERSMDVSSFDASIDESFQVCNHLALSTDHEDQMINQAFDPLPNWSSSEHLLMNNINQVQEDALMYGDNLDQSLLLDHVDVDDDEQFCPNYNSFSYVCSQISQQEVSIYDYELSGLIY